MQNLNNVPFLCTKLFQKRDTIQGGTLFKGGHYLRKYGKLKLHCIKKESERMMIIIENDFLKKPKKLTKSSS